MIPLRDENARRVFPFVTFAILITNIAVFVYQAWFGRLGYDNYIASFGLVPWRLVHWVQSPAVGQILPPITLWTSIFMHGGILHIVSNMWFLWVFADNVEETLGWFRFLLFYFLTGTLASLTHVVLDPSSNIPLVGASGAIAGVLGGYFLLFPRHRILTLVPIIFYVTVVRIPAAFFLGLWFLTQVLYSKAGGSVAWYAHIGGFISGLILIRVFVPSKN